MTDYARLVDDIRSFLQSTDQTLTEELRGWAEAYSSACRETNQRLRRCEDFLEKGLQSEAVHFAQGEPALLDVVAALDFPERAQWEEICSFYSLPAPPRLMLSTAEALNEAYANIQPLQHLLRKHRLLALSRAPLSERLTAMRQLAAVDAGNPVWGEDIGEFEAVRGRQIESELREAVRTEDGRTVDALVAETRATSWQNGPPAGLLATAQWAAQIREARRVQEKFRGMVHDLAVARKAEDIAALRELQERWNEEANRHHLRPNDPLWAEANPAFHWLAAQERRTVEIRKQRAALIRLEEGIADKSVTRPALEKLYKAVMIHDGTIDNAIDEKYRNRLRALDESAQQRRKFIGLSVAIATVFFVLAIGYWVFQSLRDARIAESARTVREMLSAGALTDARHYLDQLKEQRPDIASTARIQSLKQQVDASIAAETERAARFQEAMKAAQAAPMEGAEPPTLVTARSLATSSVERLQVDQLVRARTERAGQMRKKTEAGFRTTVTEIEARIQKLEPLAVREPDSQSTHETWDKLQSDLNQLIASGSNVREDVRDLAKPLVARLDAIRLGMAEEREQQQLIDQMSHALVAKQDLAVYAALMQKFVDHFPTVPRGLSFGRSVKETPLWQAEETWSRLIGPATDRLFELAPDDAEILRGRIAEFVATHQQFIDADAAEKCLACLGAIAQQDEKVSAKAAARLRELFSNWRYKRLWFVVEDGQTYYVVRDPQPDIDQARRTGNDLIHVRFIADQLGNEKPHNAMVKRISSYGPCGASRVADTVLGMQPNFANPSWDKAMLTILHDLSTTKDIDPIARLELLRTVTDLASKGSHPLSLALTELRSSLNTGPKDLSKADWMLPNANLAALRQAAEQTVQRSCVATSFKDLATKAAARHDEIQATIRHSMHQLVGWLSWRRDKGWECVGPNLAGRWQLMVICPDLHDQKPKWKTIGDIENGRTVISSENEFPLVEGRLVFASPIYR
jgi:hypothetical protein